MAGMERTITAAEAERFYDRLGNGIDRFASFEQRARLDLLEHGHFDQARAVLEVGCGTGQLAARLLERHLPPEASYLGFDVSTTMVTIAAARLDRWARRAKVHKSDGTLRLGEADGTFDRFVSTYLLDLLSGSDAALLLDEAHRLLGRDGLLCLVSLTSGQGLLSRVVSTLWRRIQQLAPARVGGCRPIELRPLLAADRWVVEYWRIVTMLGVPAEVVVARRR